MCHEINTESKKTRERSAPKNEFWDEDPNLPVADDESEKKILHY